MCSRILAIKTCISRFQSMGGCVLPRASEQRQPHSRHGQPRVQSTFCQVPGGGIDGCAVGKSLGSHPGYGEVVIPKDRPPDFVDVGLRSVEVEAEDFEGRRYDEVLSRKECEAMVATMYKRKDRKVLPVNTPLPGGVNPGGGLNGMGDDARVLKKGKMVTRGSRLTPERLAAMKIGNGLLTEKERQLFVDILFEFEAAVAFEDSEMGLLDPSIDPPAPPGPPMS
jgi:hypothetical protein